MNSGDLARYREKNPVKYAHKYGTKTPEEVSAIINNEVPPTPPSAIKVEITPDKPEVEAGFSEENHAENPPRKRKYVKRVKNA